MVRSRALADSDEEDTAQASSTAFGSSRVSGAMAKKAQAMWKAHDHNPNLHQHPVEYKTPTPSQAGTSKPRRHHIRPLQQIHKPLSALTHAVRQVVHAGAASMFGSVHTSTRVHGIPCSTVLSSETGGSSAHHAESCAGSILETSPANFKAQLSDTVATRACSPREVTTDVAVLATPVAEGMEGENAPKLEDAYTAERHRTSDTPEVRTRSLAAPELTVPVKRPSSLAALDIQGYVPAAFNILPGTQQVVTSSHGAAVPLSSCSVPVSTPGAVHVVQVAEPSVVGIERAPPRSAHAVTSGNAEAAAPAAKKTGEDVVPFSADAFEQNATHGASIMPAHAPVCPEDADAGQADFPHTTAVPAYVAVLAAVPTGKGEGGAETGASLASGTLGSEAPTDASPPPGADTSPPLSRGAYQQLQVVVPTQGTASQASDDFDNWNVAYGPCADSELPALPQYVQGGHCFHDANEAMACTSPEVQVRFMLQCLMLCGVKGDPWGLEYTF